MAFGTRLHKLLGYPPISAIQIASLHPGDLLVAQLPRHATIEHATHIRDLLKERLPSTVTCAVIISDEIRLEVVRVVNPDRPFNRPIGG